MANSNVSSQKNEKSGCQTRVRQTIATEIFVRPDAELTASIFHECATYQPKSILIAFCHLYFYVYTMLADYNAQIVF